jgi:hypothetical protein
MKLFILKKGGTPCNNSTMATRTMAAAARRERESPFGSSFMYKVGDDCGAVHAFEGGSGGPGRADAEGGRGGGGAAQSTLRNPNQVGSHNIGCPSNPW